MTLRLLRGREERLPSETLQRHVLSSQLSSLELSTTRAIKKASHGPIRTIDLDAAESRFLLSGSADSRIHLYDLDENQPVRRRPEIDQGSSLSLPKTTYVCKPIASVDRHVGHKYSVTAVRWFPRDTGLFTTSSMDGELKVWDTNVFKSVTTFAIGSHVYVHEHSPISLNHSLIATGTMEAPVRLCDLRSGAYVQVLSGHRGAVLSVKWSPRDEYLLASGSADHGIRLWDVRKARTCLLSLDQHNTNTASIPRHGSVSAHNGSVNGLAFTSDGLHLVSTGHDETIRLWDVFAGKNALVNYGPHVRNRVDHVLQPVISPLNATETPLIFHPSDNRQILAFNLWTGKLEMRLRRHAGRVSCVALRDNANSFELYSGGNDHEILCWQSRRAKEDLSD